MIDFLSEVLLAYSDEIGFYIFLIVAIAITQTLLHIRRAKGFIKEMLAAIGFWAVYATVLISTTTWFGNPFQEILIWAAAALAPFAMLILIIEITSRLKNSLMRQFVLLPSFVAILLLSYIILVYAAYVVDPFV